MRLRWPLLVGVSALLLAIVFSCVALVGCSNYCLNVQTNPGGTINTNTSCQTTTMTGNVALSIGALQESDSTGPMTTAPARATQVFVTLRGVDAFADPLPGDDAPAWRELAPQLASRPAQIDLNAPVGDFCTTSQLGMATVPAGIYRQLRLRVVPNPDSSPAANPPTIAAKRKTAAVGRAAIMLVRENTGGNPSTPRKPPENKPSQTMLLPSGLDPSPAK